MSEFTAIHLKSRRSLIVRGIPEEITVLVEAGADQRAVIHRFLPDDRIVTLHVAEIEFWEEWPPPAPPRRPSALFQSLLFFLAAMGLLIYVVLIGVGTIHP